MSEAEDGGGDAPGQAEQGADPHHEPHHQHVQVVAAAFLKIDYICNVSPDSLDILTLSLCSFLLTMTEVICWSMKRRMVSSRAGMELRM